MTVTKAKRKLTNIDFSQDNSHIALVSKDQGGPANGADYKLILKSNKNFTPEVIEKAQQVKVTMELPEFLRKFFGVYYEDAEVLARMMGYVEPEKEEVDYDDWYEYYIEEKLKSFEIIKSLHEGNVPEIMSNLTGNEYVQLLKDQALVEKAFRKQARLEKKTQKDSEVVTAASKEGETEAVAKAKESDVNQAKVEPSGTNKTKTGEKNMDEVVELQKALDTQKAELQKALEVVEALKAEKQEQVVKSKVAKVTDVVKEQAHAEVLVKAALALESDADFTAFVDVVKALHDQIEKSGLFQEQGVSAEQDNGKDEDSNLTKLIKARYSKQD